MKIEESELVTGKCANCNCDSCDLIPVVDADGDFSFAICADCNNAIGLVDDNNLPDYLR